MHFSGGLLGKAVATITYVLLYKYVFLHIAVVDLNTLHAVTCGGSKVPQFPLTAISQTGHTSFYFTLQNIMSKFAS